MDPPGSGRGAPGGRARLGLDDRVQPDPGGRQGKFFDRADADFGLA